MNVVAQSLSGVGHFILYFAISIGYLFLFKLAYTRATPQDEWFLVKEKQSTAAAVGFGGALVGFALALAGAVANSLSLIDFILWGAVAVGAQIGAFALLRFTFMPRIAERISNDEVSAGVMLAAMSVAVGLINAACMTY